MLLYVIFAFSFVVVLFAGGRFKSIGQNSKTVKVTKFIIVAAIILAIVAVIEAAIGIVRILVITQYMR